MTSTKVLKMKTSAACALSLAVAVVSGVLGCQEPSDSASSNDSVSAMPPATMDDHSDHDHAHPSEGPHHGDLVELGNEEYHAEIVHDDDRNILEVYILDGSATKEVAISASELTINLTHDGAPEQFTLTAKGVDGDSTGKSSCFVSTDAELLHHLDEEDTHPRLVVKIDGKSFRGEIVHSHEGHDHDHGHK